MRIPGTPRHVGRAGALVVAAIGAFAIAHAAGVASAQPIDIWVHDHSSDVIKPRPDGLSEIRATFGPVCGDNSNGARSYWPSQDAQRSRLRLLRPVHRQERRRQHPRPRRVRPQGRCGSLAGRWLQLPIHLGDDRMVAPRVGGRDRHQQRDQPGRPGSLERDRIRRQEVRHLPPRRLGGPVSGPQVLLGPELAEQARPHALPVRDRLLSGRFDANEIVDRRRPVRRDHPGLDDRTWLWAGRRGSRVSGGRRCGRPCRRASMRSTGELGGSRLERRRAAALECDRAAGGDERRGGTAYVEDERGADAIVVSTPRGTRVLPQSGEAYHPDVVGPRCGRLGRRRPLVVRSASAERTIAGPQPGGIVFAPVFVGRGIVAAVSAAPTTARARR